MPADACLFCRIATGEIRADVVAQTDTLLAFKDINPQAPTHLLVIPRTHVASLADASTAPAGLFEQAMRFIGELARRLQLEESGYRVVANTGAAAGQTVSHLHFHLMGGRRFTWPPG